VKPTSPGEVKDGFYNAPPDLFDGLFDGDQGRFQIVAVEHQQGRTVQRA
jgi:hypothetical protein